MKKVLVVLLSVYFMFTNFTVGMAETEIPKFNEDFSIRNGIRFGMSIDEVKNIEAATGEPEIEEDKKAGDFNCDYCEISSFLIGRS